MASGIEILKLIIDGDGKKAIAEMNKVEAASKKSLGAAEDQTKKTGKGFSALGIDGAKMGAFVAAGAATAGAALIKFGADSVRAAADDQKAHAALRQAVQNTGVAYDSYGSKIKDTEEKLIGLGFADDETAASLTQLVGVTKNTNVALKDVALAADIARGRNISLAAASSILTKVEAGKVGALGRLGIATKDATGATISQEEAIRRLTALYGGQAAAYAATYAGKIDALKATFQELQESVGNALLPTLTSSASGLLAVTNAATKAAKATGPLGISLGDVAHFGLELAPVTNVVAGAFDVLGVAQHKNKDESSALTDVQKRLSESQKQVAEDVANHTTKTEEGRQHQEAYKQALADSNAVATGLASATDDAAAAQKNMDAATKATADHLKEATDRAKDYTEAIFGTRDANRDALTATLDVNDAVTAYGEAVKTSGDQSEEAIRAFLGQQAAVDKVAESTGKAYDEQVKLTGGVASADARFAAQKQSLEALAQKYPQLAAYIQQLIDNLARIPRVTTSTINIETNFSGPAGGAAFGVGRRGTFRAAGGPVSQGEQYIVGEQGPELFTPGSNGSITPNGKWGGNVYISVSSFDPKQAAKLVKDALVDLKSRGYQVA